MTRHARFRPPPPLLVATLLGLVASCRVGYDELRELGFGAGGADAGGSSSGASAGRGTGGSGAGAAQGGGGGDGAGDTGGLGPGGEAGAGEDPIGGSSGAGNAGQGGSSGTGTAGQGGSSGGSSGSTGMGGTSGGSDAGGGAGGSSGGGSGGSSGDGSGGSSGDGSGGSSGGGSGGAGAGSGGSSGAGGSAGAPDPGLCTTGSYAGHDYLLCREERSWFSAASGCAAQGMQLVRIDDAGENQWLYDNANTSPGRASLVWIGASDLAAEGEWRWTDGELFWLGNNTGMAQNGLFNAWYFREPNNVSMSEHCASLETTGSVAEWYDSRCDGAAPFICESL